jgi:peptidoglycan/LPS O-acetylase OafA/YrhL
MISKKAYVPAIDVVRCFAALSVTLFHLAITWPHVAVPLKVLPPYPDMSFLNGYLYFGFVGVEIFFVISGFVIAASCQGRRPGDFFVGRALRILPLLWTVVLAETVIHLVAGAPLMPTLVAAFRSMTIWPNGGWLNSVVWTLVPECVFYAIIWASLTTRVSTERALIAIAYALAIGCGAFQLFSLAFGSPGGFLPTFLLLRHGAHFALGIALWARSRGQAGLLPIFCMAIPGALLEINQQTLAYGQDAHVFYPAALPAAVWAAAVILIAYASKQPSAELKPWVRIAGLVTFPIYLLHKTCGALIVAAAFAAGVPAIPAVALGMIATVAIAWALVEFVEPILRPIFRRGLELVARNLNFARFAVQRP